MKNPPTVSKREQSSPQSNLPKQITYAGFDNNALDIAQNQVDLASFSEEYEQLNSQFKRELTNKEKYTIRERINGRIYKIFRSKKKTNELRKTALERKYKTFASLVVKMYDTLEQQYKITKQCKEQGHRLQLENLSHTKFLDNKIVDNFKSQLSSSLNTTKAEQQVGEIEIELQDIQKQIEEYENKMCLARTENPESTQPRLEEITKLFDKKQSLFEEKLNAELSISKEKSNFMESVESIESAKNAITASKVNYQTIDLLIEAYNELEIKYKNALELMFPVFVIQGKIAILASEAFELKDELIKIAETSQALMKANTELVIKLSKQTTELVKKPIYNVEEAKKAEELLRKVKEELKEQKSLWASGVQKALASFDWIRNNHARYEFLIKTAAVAGKVIKYLV